MYWRKQYNFIQVIIKFIAIIMNVIIIIYINAQ